MLLEQHYCICHTHLSYQEIFFENGNSKVAVRNNVILTVRETHREIYTVKDLYCQILLKSGH